jgi:hypothetical protein
MKAPSPELRTFMREVIRLQSHLHLYIRLIPFDDAYVAISLLFLNGQYVDHSLHCGQSGPEAMFLALIKGTERVIEFGDSNIFLSVFVPNGSLSSHLFSLHKHRFLHYSSLFKSHISKFLGADNLTHTIRLFWYSTKWSGLPGTGFIEEAAAKPPPPLSTLSQPSLVSRKEEAYQSWRNDTMILPRRRSHADASISLPDGNKFPPYVRGLLTARNRHLLCAGLQLTTRHCFDAKYSFDFRPNAGDETACPCSFTPSRHVESIRAEHNSLSSPIPSPSSTDDPPPIVSHTVTHVLTICPLTAHHRELLLHNSTLAFIFCTEEGGKALAHFLHYTQLLLRPLPPRPDPP